MWVRPTSTSLLFSPATQGDPQCDGCRFCIWQWESACACCRAQELGDEPGLTVSVQRGASRQVQASSSQKTVASAPSHHSWLDCVDPQAMSDPPPLLKFRSMFAVTLASALARTRASTLAKALSTSSSAALAHATAGPLWPQLKQKLGAKAMPSADEWTAHGEAITAALLGHSAPFESLDAATAARVYHLYLPIYFFARGKCF